MRRSVLPLGALVLVTAIWGVTFVQIKDALDLYPLFAFLAVRFAIAVAVLAVPVAPRLRSLGRSGALAGVALGGLLAAGYALQTAGLERTTVSAAGFVTGMYVVLTPIFGLVLFRIHPELAVWLGVALAVTGLALLSGVSAGSVTGDLMVLAAAALYALQIALMERLAPRYDPLAFTTAEMGAAFVGFAVIAVAAGGRARPRGAAGGGGAAAGRPPAPPPPATVWGALLVTGIFASAFGYLVQAWAQQRTSATRTALVFALEPVFAGIFGFALAGDRLGVVGWTGCAVILCGIAVAEPAAAGTLARLVRVRRPA
jgi:drug/metabolite transporter (DMT)-like permease